MRSSPPRDAPPAPRNVNFLARSLLAFGSAAQQQRWLPALLACEEIWCQGFSEPDAGSDLASLRTRAVRHDDAYVVNGQKVWTTFGKWADWCLALVRTDPAAPKHQGISALAVRLDSPGITVRPIHQISHSEELAEVFFEDVEVPVEQLVGRPGDGWRLAMRTVALERGPAEIGAIARALRTLAILEEGDRQGRYRHVPDARLRLARVRVHLEVFRLHVLRTLSESKGEPPGPESSVGKLMMGGTEQELASLGLELAGEAALVGDDSLALNDYLQSRALTIYGGTAQIQKNIIAQRILKMPQQ
jgi:alkylation response protein AidB-like acyl-CoA dehydrogenase